MIDPRQLSKANVVAGRKGFVTVPLADRFWSKVAIGGPDECWPWLGATRSTALAKAYTYGIIWVQGRHRPAHQVAWELAHGEPFPEGLMACHTCDNPPCVNPAHIFPGTMTDNIQDAVRKGRTVRGEAINGARLTPELVKEIRASWESTATLARRFGVGRTAIDKVRTGRTWRHVE